MEDAQAATRPRRSHAIYGTEETKRVGKNQVRDCCVIVGTLSLMAKVEFCDDS